ncbi:endonuclease/exonuclease/phosphatase family protein [Methanobrevibacter sp.]|uniref:endonuclease/exonuclease/phosphatase family protein n=1 Tax=Methanobrevibacter sp. TaxID=66852 RepID=UPI0026DFB916|nr:endonuclease/exonuclease/phosphatase family protein [Methanobrevibacter sp.]MDO5859117.1 hypothetical protein [Methanobrevibacter sp.]
MGEIHRGNTMKIITWNCNGKFHESFKEIIKENADIYVIQECGNPIESKTEEYRRFASNYFWVGEDKYRGLGIFARDDVDIKLVDLDDNGLRYFIPVRVNDSFNLLGIWTNPNKKYKTNEYPKEITRYYELHKDSDFFNEDMIICGDFNCDARLKKTHARNVFEMKENLEDIGLVDTYHYLNDEKQGEESQATFYMYRHLDKPYHLDHIFESPGRIKYLKIGGEERWLKESDHLPMIFEI